MAFTQAQLDALEEAIAGGVTRVKYTDKEVEYRSINEMMRVRDLMRRSLGLLADGSGRIYAQTSKGLKGR